jgi:hypothetical protein
MKLHMLPTLFLTSLLSFFSLGTLAGTLNFTGTLTPGGPQEPQTALISTPNCNGAYIAFSILYQAFPFTVDTTGTYLFSEPGTDSAVYVYANSFDPSLPANNCIAASNTNPISGLSVNLTAGTQYYFVAVEDSFDQDGMSINGSVTGPGNISAPLTNVPTLSELGIGMLSALLAVGALVIMRRRQDTSA